MAQRLRSEPKSDLRSYVQSGCQTYSRQKRKKVFNLNPADNSVAALYAAIEALPQSGQHLIEPSTVGIRLHRDLHRWLFPGEVFRIETVAELTYHFDLRQSALFIQPDFQ